MKRKELNPELLTKVVHHYVQKLNSNQWFGTKCSSKEEQIDTLFTFANISLMMCYDYDETMLKTICKNYIIQLHNFLKQEENKKGSNRSY